METDQNLLVLNSQNGVTSDDNENGGGGGGSVDEHSQNQDDQRSVDSAPPSPLNDTNSAHNASGDGDDDNDEHHDQSAGDSSDHVAANGQKRHADFDPASNSARNNSSQQQKRQRTENYNGSSNGSSRNTSGNGVNSTGSGSGFKGKTELRVLLQSKDAGAIIGRGGANIKKLRQEHKTIIQVPDCDGPERLLLVSGDTDATISTLLDIFPLLDDNQKNPNGPIEMRLLVHQSQAGCIIGRGGDKIKDLRTKHNLEMKVYSECAPMSTDRICQMKGKRDEVIECLQEVLGLLESAPPKGLTRAYDPHNYNEMAAMQYGGFTSDKFARGGNGGPASGGPGYGQGSSGSYGMASSGYNQAYGAPPTHQRSSYGPGGSSGGRSQRGGSQPSYGGYNDGYSSRGPSGPGGRPSRNAGPGPSPYSSSGRSDKGHSRGPSQGPSSGYGGNVKGGYGSGRPQGGSSMGRSSQSGYGGPGMTAGPNLTNQVTIPNEFAGAIIGPKGQKIAQIREQSGAGITIDKPVPGNNERIITISGTPEQIQNAQYLLQMTVKSSGLWNGN